MSDYQCIDVEQLDSITKVRIVDSKILDQGLVKQLAEELQALLSELTEPKLLFDLAAVNFLSSAALNNLVILNKKVQKQNGKIVLTGVQPQIYEIFNITGLNRWFKVTETMDEAIAEMESTD